MPSVAVTAINSYRFTVSGEVEAAGIKSHNDYVTVAEAIAMAGGFTRFAKRDRIIITRRAPSGRDQFRRIPIDYDAIMDGNAAMNLVLIAGDQVFVP